MDAGNYGRLYTPPDSALFSYIQCSLVRLAAGLGFDKVVKLRPIFFRQALHTGASRRIEVPVAQPSCDDPDLRPYGSKAAMLNQATCDIRRRILRAPQIGKESRKFLLALLVLERRR